MVKEKTMQKGIAQIRDTIRSYDFKPMVGREDMYVEGEVVDINSENGYDAYVITVTKDTLGKRVGKTVFVPVEVAFMEYPGRVMNLSRI